MQLLGTLVVVLTSALAVSAGKPKPKPVPLKWGVLAFPQYWGLDIYGPLELLNIVAYYTPNMTLSIIAETMDFIPAQINGSPVGLTWVKPTYTIDQDPDIDVLLIPGGEGADIAYNNPRIIDYVKRTYPKLKYITSVCSGAQILAKAGILKGKKATTNKFAWEFLVNRGPGVKWQPCARWVVDGNIWTSSGVAAGIDMAHAFVTNVLKNETLADTAANILEVEIHKDPHWDPFCESSEDGLAPSARFQMQLLHSPAVVLTAALAISAGKPKPAPKSLPLKWGVLAFPRYVGLDAYGPLELLNIVGFSTPNMTLSIIAETMDPVPAHITNSAGALTWVKPTYTIDQDPELDVLLIPGGPGSRVAYNNTRIIDYVKRTYPKLKYITSVCTGAQVLAKAGILNGKKATTNKFSWAEMVASGPGVNWQPCARWVVDGNIWTSSGVAAGIDMAHAFVTKVFKNETLADRAANILEVEIHKDPHWDPFCKIWNTTAGGTPMTMTMSM